jgi:hypothetical protein
MFDHHAVGGVVVHDEHAESTQVSAQWLELRRTQRERQAHHERRTFAWFTAHFDLTVHRINQTLGDRKAQSGAAESSGRRRVGLSERLEQARDGLRRHTNARVANRDFQVDAR